MALWLFFVLSLSLVSAQAQDPAQVLQGTWTITSMDGKAMPAEPALTLTIAGTLYWQARGGEINERGTIQIDSSKTPMAIDFRIDEGPGAGMTQLAIADVAGDMMQLGLDLPGTNQRPLDFSVSRGAIVLIARKTTP
jgi:uncharacterized protein (TIGR03067 family)